jgi:hypothetical protein
MHRDRRHLPPLPPPIESQANPDQRESTGKPNRKASGRFAVLNAFVDHGARAVNTTAVAVWLVLYREVQPDGLATVSHAHIAERLNVTRQTVTRALKRLVTAGFISVVRPGGWQRGPSTYRVRGSNKPEGR